MKTRPADKSKRGSQKAKDSPSAPVSAQKQTAPIPVSQPPKPTSKGNKMREINMKGATREGTDMDAIKTVEVPVVMENCTQQPHQQLTQHAQQHQAPSPHQPPPHHPTPPPPHQQPQPQPQQPSPPHIQQAPPLQQPLAQQQQPSQPKALPAENVVPPIDIPNTTTPKPMMKNKVDVTSIVKDVQKPSKPFVAPTPVPPVTNSAPESQDETDRAVTEKLVQVKNEANIKANSADTNDNQINDKNVVRYKKDQWSPINTEGKKCYDRDFLICLQSNPKCKKKPENLPDLDVVLKDNRARVMEQRSFTLNRQSEVLMPAFHKSLSQRGPLPKRNSQQGKAGSKSGKPNPIHVTLSLKEDVKLRETENAWKPARLTNSGTQTEDEMKTAELYKKVRGVLNKLTPEKFDRLLSQVQALTIDNTQRLQGVIDLLFEKAVDEPNFSVAYASMCKELALMQVPAERKNKNDQVEYVNFRKLLITRCQLEFEKNSVDENARNAKVKEIEECTDPEKKKELQLLLEEDDRRMRVKSVGNIRFIGELFKQQMLTVNIMLRCIAILLENKDEDSLECLCKLLTTIGNDLEVEKKQNLSNFFVTMQEIVDKRHGKISSRVKFMLQDVIDLRNSKWVPRRQDLKPKTMEQIQKEADTEQLNIQVMNSAPINTPRKDDRMLGGNVTGGDRKRRNNATDDGWSMATSRGRATYTVESAKLMNKPPPMDEITLGSKNLFGQWGRGSNIKTQQTHAPVTNTANMYAALENINAEQDKSRGGYESRLKDAYVSKGPSMERTYKQSYEDGRGSRSGSQHRSSQQQRPTPSPSPSMKREQPPPLQPQVPHLSPEQWKLRVHNILDEYLNECCSLQECELEIRQTFEPSKIPEFVLDAYNEILERSSSARLKTGKLFASMVKNQILSMNDYCKTLKEELTQAEDLVIDIPMFWDYLVEMIVPVITENVLTLDRLCSCIKGLNQKYSAILLAQVLKQLFAEKGPSYVRDIWNSSGVSFTDFMPAEYVNSYIKENKLDFVVGGAGTPVTQGSLTWEQIHHKLLQFLKDNTLFDTMTDWISANVGERVKENHFIRTLTTAICENAAYTVNNAMKLRAEILRNHCKLLQRYVDNKEGYELQCLYAVQALVHKWEHPPGVLLGIFETMWDDFLSNECFLTWESSNDPAEQEGKGVALKSLQSLFTALKEADDDSQSTTSEDA